LNQQKMQIVPGQLETFNDFVVFSPPTMGLSAIRTVSNLESCLPQIAGVNSSSPRKIVASMAAKRFKHYVFAGWSKKYVDAAVVSKNRRLRFGSYQLG
jgi:hypothetical protein